MGSEDHCCLLKIIAVIKFLCFRLEPPLSLFLMLALPLPFSYSRSFHLFISHSFFPLSSSSFMLTPSLFLPRLPLSCCWFANKIDTKESTAIVCYENGNVSRVVNVNDLAPRSNRRSRFWCIISLPVSFSFSARLCRVMIMMRGCRWWSCWLRCLEPRTLSWLRRTNHSGSVTWAGGIQCCGSDKCLYNRDGSFWLITLLSKRQKNHLFFFSLHLVSIGWFAFGLILYFKPY